MLLHTISVYERFYRHALFFCNGENLYNPRFFLKALLQISQYILMGLFAVISEGEFVNPQGTFATCYHESLFPFCLPFSCPSLNILGQKIAMCLVINDTKVLIRASS